MIRVGIGYDSHRSSTGGPLILGGQRIPTRTGLAGHSDADAVAHALTDAILGAAAAGDIGTLFPDTDPRWKDADSIDLLRAAVALVARAGLPRGAGRRHRHPRAARASGPIGRPCAPRSRAALGIDRGRRQRQGQDQRGHGVHRPRGRSRRDRRGHGGGALIASLLDTLATMPPVAIYAILAALSFLENVFPPVPGDAVVALGAFLSVGGPLDPVVLLAVVLVLELHRRGGRLLPGATARAARSSRLGPGGGSSPPSPSPRLERGYIKYGLPGVFLGRLLPGVRAVVAPFAGLIRLPPLRALAPIALASALWFATLILIGRYIGQSWDGIQQVLKNLNTGLAVVGAARGRGDRRALAPGARRAARRACGTRCAWRSIMRPAPRGGGSRAAGGGRLHARTGGGGRAPRRHRARGAHRARARPVLPAARTRLGGPRRAGGRHPARHLGLGEPERRRLVDRMRRVAEADGTITPAEAAMIARAAALLGVDPP